jgi:hypothetical protein
MPSGPACPACTEHLNLETHETPLTRSVPSAGVTSMFNRFIAPLCYATDTASVYYHPIGDRFETLET